MADVKSESRILDVKCRAFLTSKDDFFYVRVERLLHLVNRCYGCVVEFYFKFARFPLRKQEKKLGKRHNRVHPGHFATQQGTPFYPAGMSAADWSTLVFTLPRRKMA